MKYLWNKVIFSSSSNLVISYPFWKIFFFPARSPVAWQAMQKKVFASVPSDWLICWCGGLNEWKTADDNCKCCFCLFVMMLFVCCCWCDCNMVPLLFRGKQDSLRLVTLFFFSFLTVHHFKTLISLCWFVDSCLVYVDWQIFWPNRVFRAVCLFCLFPLDVLSEDYWVSSRTMPNGSVGVFNGLLSLASVCDSVTVGKK